MQPKQRDWTEWIEVLGRDDATEQDFRDFEMALKTAPENKREYLQALADEVALELEHPLPSPMIPSSSERGSGTSNEPTHHRFSTTALSWISSVAALIAIALVIAFFYSAPRSQSPSQASTEPASPIFGTITDTNQLADNAGFKIGAFLNDETINLPSDAQIGIAMRGGARLKLNGPATLRLNSPNLVFLEKGRIQTYAPQYAHGFTIDTKDGQIIDLGTRFVTSTQGKRNNDGTEIHVLEGLVTTSPTQTTTPPTRVKAQHAVILKNGKTTQTDFLAHRFHTPLNPTPLDSDSDGVPDSVEIHYKTDPFNAKSFPDTLRISESFCGYQSGILGRVSYRGKGHISHWLGSGQFQKKGLRYANHGRELLTTGGSLTTSGIIGAGATIHLNDQELPRSDSLYISFLIKAPTTKAKHPFGGLLLYKGDYKEELFCGKISVVDALGSRISERTIQDPLATPADGKTHLFVIRIDQTRHLTDIFLDPPLGASPPAPNKRYQTAIDFDSIIVRSGSNSATYPVEFDEIRVGLTWDAVLPLKQQTSPPRK